MSQLSSGTAKEKKETRKSSCVSYANRGLLTFPPVTVFPPISSLDISNNPEIKDFTGLKFIPSLCVLRANKTGISSFVGALRLPLLEELCLDETPISKFKHLKMMSLICFGPSLKVVNGQVTTEKAIQAAEESSPTYLDWLMNGYVILNAKTKEVWKPGDKESVLLDLEPDKAKEMEQELADKTRQADELMAELSRLLRQRGKEKSMSASSRRTSSAQGNRGTKKDLSDSTDRFVDGLGQDD